MTLQDLTKDQRRLFDLVEQTNDNIFIGGKPGVGKTVLIRALTDFGAKTYYVGAPTGLAATNGGGRTIHSLFKIPVSDGILDPTFNRFTTDDRTVNHIRFNLRTLIIDEISMVRCDVLDYIDRLCRRVKNNDRPFGGIQVIAVGDFFQLPPVTKDRDLTELRNAGWASPFAFDAKVWQSFKAVELTEVLRQKGDPMFINLLHNARIGKEAITNKQLVALNDQVNPAPDDIRIRLTGTNNQAEERNQSELAKLPEPTVTFRAETFGVWPMSGGRPVYPCEEMLSLKIGAQVMVKRNAADRPPKHKGEFESKVVNGTLGIVREIFDGNVYHAHSEGFEPKEQTPYIIIELRDGTTATIYRRRWERKVKEKVGDEWEERVVASFEQMPLALAWAISMHKSQGQSFDAVHIDASKIFAPGQLYVALSRCRTLEGVSLQARVSKEKFWANPSVLRYFETLQHEQAKA